MYCNLNNNSLSADYKTTASCPVFKRGNAIAAGPLGNFMTSRINCYRKCVDDVMCNYLSYNEQRSQCQLFTTAYSSTGLTSTNIEFELIRN